METEFRRLPGVDRVLAEESISRLEEAYPHDLLVGVIRQRLEDERRSIAAGNPCASLEEIAAAVSEKLRELGRPGPRRAVNAAGVVLHTNLGRAPLCREALEAMAEAGRGYCDLEFEIESGTRGSRQVHVEEMLCQLTGAEAALVVNNNAAAVLLGLTALAKRREAIVSRGQAVEIGGGFRIPDVMRQSGAKLVEVGTTNCTYAADFERAITPRTAVLLRVHSSNFKVVGFATEVSLPELVALAGKHGLTVMDDLGSGALLDTADFGLAPEPMVPESIAAGADLVCFSGDKLVGGPQAGIIVGKKACLDKLKKHPLARAVRIDKVRLAGLTATLVHYLKGEALAKIPVWRMMATPLEEIERRAAIWAGASGGAAKVVPGETMVGGGSLPGGSLPTRLVAIGGVRNKKNLAQAANRRLRLGEIPVIGRIEKDVLLLDPRTVLPEEDEIVLKALGNLADILK